MSVGFSGPHLHLLSKLWSIKSCVEITLQLSIVSSLRVMKPNCFKNQFIKGKEILSSFKAHSQELGCS